jgi:hypothetical protein
MIWRRTSPLAAQLLQLSEVVGRAAKALRDGRNPDRHGAGAVPHSKRSA